MRWISGIIVAISAIAMLTYAPASLVLAFIVALTGLSLWEYFDMVGLKDFYLIKVVGVFLGLAFNSIIMWQADSLTLLAFIAVAVISSFVLFLLGPQPIEKRTSQMAFYFLGLFYVGGLFAFLGLIRQLDHWSFWVYLVLVATFAADTGAYLIGRWLGKRKLAPDLSPGKTIEGFLGGLVFAIIGALVVRYLFLPDFALIKLLTLAVLTATIGPIGDLSESFLKRSFNTKDSGFLFPGHGGLLDRFDALMFNAPVVYFFAVFFG